MSNQYASLEDISLTKGRPGETTFIVDMTKTAIQSFTPSNPITKVKKIDFNGMFFYENFLNINPQNTLFNLLVVYSYPYQANGNETPNLRVRYQTEFSLIPVSFPPICIADNDSDNFPSKSKLSNLLTNLCYSLDLFFSEPRYIWTKNNLPTGVPFLCPLNSPFCPVFQTDAGLRTTYSLEFNHNGTQLIIKTSSPYIQFIVLPPFPEQYSLTKMRSDFNAFGQGGDFYGFGTYDSLTNDYLPSSPVSFDTVLNLLKSSGAHGYFDYNDLINSAPFTTCYISTRTTQMLPFHYFSVNSNLASFQKFSFVLSNNTRLISTNSCGIVYTSIFDSGEYLDFTVGGDSEKITSHQINVEAEFSINDMTFSFLTSTGLSIFRNYDRIFACDDVYPLKDIPASYIITKSLIPYNYFSRCQYITYNEEGIVCNPNYFYLTGNVPIVSFFRLIGFY